MKTKIILTCSALGLSVLGAICALNASGINMYYTIGSSVIFAAVGLGGVKQYHSPENRDLRDFLEDLREKNRELRSQVNKLEEALIQKEKQEYAATVKSSSRNSEVFVSCRADE